MSESLPADLPDQRPLMIDGTESLPRLRPPSKPETPPLQPDCEPPTTIAPSRATDIEKRKRRKHYGGSLVQRLRVLDRRADLALGSVAIVLSTLVGAAIASLLK